jgi:SWI/SNF-related matrix-associated actin-dependent regulator 1 of chromatin subfamily A
MQLYPHQIEARDFLLAKKRAILADAPRVGKSLSTAAATVQHLPALIVCPAIVKSVWQKAIHAIDPDVPILVVNGKASAAGLTKQPGVTIVNYELLQYLPKKARFETLVLDECHRIKNPKAARTKAALTLTKACPRVYALSGTIVPNRPSELWAILHGLGVYRGGWHDYVYRYCKAWTPPWGGIDVSGASNLPELKALIKPHMLRRKKEDVFKDYKEPQVSLITFDLPVDRRERQFDADALVRNPEALLAFEGLSEIMREAGVKKIGPSAEFIDDLLQSGDPVVVFAHHKDVVHGLCEKLQDHKPVVIVGDTPRAQRDQNIADFQSGKTNLIVGNISSMAEGVDLSRADIIVFVEATWQTSALEQASSRVENIQKNGIPPLVYILTIRASLDHEVLARILAKQKIINQII